MEGHKVFLQHGYILQHKPFRESSLILDVLTRDYGLISLLAKGVRKAKSRTAGVLLPFSLLKFSYQDRLDLKLLLDVEYQTQHALSHISLYCGFYVNELIQRFLQRQDPDPELFDRYQRVLVELALLADESPDNCLRRFELDLLRHAGYEVLLDTDISTGRPVIAGERYCYQPNEGMIKDHEGPMDGEVLLALAKGEDLYEVTHLQQAKLLLRGLLAPHLQAKPLKSRAVLAKVMQFL